MKKKWRHEYRVIDSKAKNVVLHLCNPSGDSLELSNFYVFGNMHMFRHCFHTHTVTRIAEMRGLYNLLQTHQSVFTGLQLGP